jgi:hypothetical protein
VRKLDCVTICNKPLQIKEWEAQRVVTLRDIDAVHERPEGTARKRFNDNRQHFILGEDYFKICASEFRTHKLGDLSSKAHEDITLFTESGYLMLVKSFTDDLAWQVQRALVNSYFRAKSGAKSGKIRAKPEDVIARQQFHIAQSFAEMTGIPLGIAAATALKIIEERTGLDYSHWKLALPARTDEKPVPHLNATKLGALVGASAQDANRLLEAAGLQTKMGKQWRLTDAGKAYAEEYPFERNGHSDYRILWCDSAAEALKGGASK